MQKQQSNQQTAKAPVISNVVATANITITGKNSDSKNMLDLDEIAKKCQNVTYNKKRFPAIIMRKTAPVKGTGLIFGTGKLVIIGVKSVEDAKKLPRHILKDIQKVLVVNKKEDKQQFSVSDTNIKNIVASSDVGFQINLIKIDEDIRYGDFTTKHENFPGMVFKYNQNERKLAALLFSSGKIVFTGAKSQEDLDNAYQYFTDILQGFKQIKKI